MSVRVMHPSEGQRREAFLRRTLKRLRGMHGFNEVGASKEGNQVKREDEVGCFWMVCGLSSFLNDWLAVDISVD
jgi:hypothetical protein